MITRRNDMDVVKEIAGKGIEILNSGKSLPKRLHEPLTLTAHQIFPETKSIFHLGSSGIVFKMRFLIPVEKSKKN